MVLEKLDDGGSGVVARIQGGSGMRSRLLRLGIIPGVPVRKLQGGSNGPVVLEVLGSNVMLGRGMAEVIEIR
ncbi:MAG TPA: ferrous iron transport protein A [Magnetospirillaceae bacterium]|nr:ferrous iron transport protein A [Magnetospirillaceae bacterium]